MSSLHCPGFTSLQTFGQKTEKKYVLLRKYVVDYRNKSDQKLIADFIKVKFV